MTDDSQLWHAVQPSGLSAAMLAITIVFTPLCAAVVSLRIWVRLTSHCFGLEDWLMCIGTVCSDVS